MPKQRITKEMIEQAAFEVAREEGIEAIKVNTIANKLGCSVQPIYSYCDNMEGLRESLNNKIRDYVHQYISKRINTQNLFQSTGRAYIQLAQEEPHLLKLFILQERKNISSIQDFYSQESSPKMSQFISKELNISVQKAKELHLHLLIYTIGIGTIFSNASPGIPIEEIYQQQEQAYQAFLSAILENHR